MLDANIKTQLKAYLEKLLQPIELVASLDDSAKAQDAATNMKITAQDLLKFGIIDGIIPEPMGGAHRDPHTTMQAAGDTLWRSLSEISEKAPEDIRKARRDKFLAIGRGL